MYVRWALMLIGWLALMECPVALGGVQQVRYAAGAASEEFSHAYPVRVLQLALDKTTHEYGAARVVQANAQTGATHIMEELMRGERVDVANLPASHSLEEYFVPVPICIRKGILGVRLFLIDRRRQAEFSALHDVEGLKRLTAGQGVNWLDTRVLRGNGLKVETTASYEGLFAMLMSKQFDYFPRGLYEPFMEVQQRAAQMPNLAVEKTLALYYPSPDFFWVRKGNEALAERLRKGLETAISDGSFEKLFQSEFAEPLHLAQLDQRRILRIQNPEYDKILHAGDGRYWQVDQPHLVQSMLKH